ncbi:hypothetical protein [Streptomyces sp. NPDC054887]
MNQSRKWDEEAQSPLERVTGEKDVHPEEEGRTREGGQGLRETKSGAEDAEAGAEGTPKGHSGGSA